MAENENTNGLENYPMDEALISLLGDIVKAREQLQKQADMLGAQEQGALVLFIRQHKLTGNWEVAPNGRELAKKAAPAAKVEGGA